MAEHLNAVAITRRIDAIYVCPQILVDVDEAMLVEVDACHVEPDVLGVRASLVDLKLAPALGGLPVKGRAAALVANGQLTFFMELTDSQSGEVIGRAADQEKPADDQVAVASGATQWVETEAAARRWAAMFRDFLDRRLGS